MGNLKRFLTQFDLFRQPLMLQISNDQYHQTFFGGLLSATITTVCLLIFLDQISVLVNRVRPICSVSQEYLNGSSQQKLNTFVPMIFGIYDNNNKPYKDQGIYQSYLYQCSKNQTDQQCSQLPIIDCSQQQYKNTLTQYFPLDDPTQLYCVNYTYYENSSLYLSGFSQSETQQWLNLNITSCDNSKENENCKTNQYLQLNSGYFKILSYQNIFNVKNYNHILQSTQKVITTPFSIQYPKIMDFEYQFVKAITDGGYFLTDEISVESLNNIENYEKINMASHDFLSISISLNSKRTLYYRYYKKIQEILGVISGLWILFLAIGSILISPLIHLSLNVKLVNKIFSFEPDLEEIERKRIKKEKQEKKLEKYIKKEKKKKKKKEMEKIYKNFQDFQQSQKKPPSESILNLAISKAQTQAQMFTIIKQYFNQSLNKMKFRFIDYIRYIFYSNNIKYKQLEYGVEKVQEKLDIVFIIKKLIEVDKLKVLLLNDNQLKLFEYIPKPNIPINIELLDIKNQEKKLQKDNIGHQKIEQLKNISSQKDSQHWQMFSSDKPFILRAVEALDSYNVLINQDYKSNIDVKLLSMIDENIIKIFQQEMKKKKSGNELNFMENPDSPEVDSPLPSIKKQVDRSEISSK